MANRTELKFFDCNCAFGPYRTRVFRFARTADELVEEMDFSNIDRALVYHTAMRFDHPAVGNELVVRATEGRPRLLPTWALLPSQTDTFVLPAQFTYGNAGRNILRGDRLVQLDMSLIKNFKLTESKNIDFRAQVFNLTNTPSFGGPGGSTNLATGGTVTSTRNQPRLYEFGVKFAF